MVGALQEYVMETIDAWSFVLDAVASYFDRYISKRSEVQEIPRTISFYKDLGTDPFASLLQELIGAFYVEMIDLLGKRTAQMHMALGSARGGDEAFLPEPFSSLYQRSLYQSIRYQIRKGFSLLSENVKKVPDLVMDDVRELLGPTPDFDCHYKSSQIWYYRPPAGWFTSNFDEVELERGATVQSLEDLPDVYDHVQLAFDVNGRLHAYTWIGESYTVESTNGSVKGSHFSKLASSDF